MRFNLSFLMALVLASMLGLQPVMAQGRPEPETESEKVADKAADGFWDSLSDGEKTAFAVGMGVIAIGAVVGIYFLAEDDDSSDKPADGSSTTPTAPSSQLLPDDFGGWASEGEGGLGLTWRW